MISSSPPSVQATVSAPSPSVTESISSSTGSRRGIRVRLDQGPAPIRLRARTCILYSTWGVRFPTHVLLVADGPSMMSRAGSERLTTFVGSLVRW